MTGNGKNLNATLCGCSVKIKKKNNTILSVGWTSIIHTGFSQYFSWTMRIIKAAASFIAFLELNIEHLDSIGISNSKLTWAKCFNVKINWTLRRLWGTWKLLWRLRELWKSFRDKDKCFPAFPVRTRPAVTATSGGALGLRRPRPGARPQLTQPPHSHPHPPIIHP